MTQRIEETCEDLQQQIAHLAKQLDRANQDLRRSRDELQEFAYLASHDLQEPLRKIKAFGDLLVSKHGDSIGDDGQDYLRRMQNAAERMGTLIDDLLAYARVTSKAGSFESLDLNQIAAAVISELDRRIRANGGRVQCGALPTIEADPTQMCQLFRHVIGNALQYHRSGHPPHVLISQVLPMVDVGLPEGESLREYCQIRFQDEGIGIEQRFADRVFLPFQRLHTWNEYQGTGMGLAIARKIIERHHGDIRVQAEVEQGASFLVTLPQSQ